MQFSLGYSAIVFGWFAIISRLLPGEKYSLFGFFSVRALTPCSLARLLACSLKLLCSVRAAVSDVAGAVGRSRHHAAADPQREPRGARACFSSPRSLCSQRVVTLLACLTLALFACSLRTGSRSWHRGRLHHFVRRLRVVQQLGLPRRSHHVRSSRLLSVRGGS